MLIEHLRTENSELHTELDHAEYSLRFHREEPERQRKRPTSAGELRRQLADAKDSQKVAEKNFLK